MSGEIQKARKQLTVEKYINGKYEHQYDREQHHPVSEYTYCSLTDFKKLIQR